MFTPPGCHPPALLNRFDCPLVCVYSFFSLSFTSSPLNCGVMRADPKKNVYLQHSRPLSFPSPGPCPNPRSLFFLRRLFCLTLWIFFHTLRPSNSSPPRIGLDLGFPVACSPVSLPQIALPLASRFFEPKGNLFQPWFVFAARLLSLFGFRSLHPPPLAGKTLTHGVLIPGGTRF